MRYDAYERKMMKVADVARSVLRHSTKIIIGLAAVAVTVIALLATRGIVISASCPAEVEYGDAIELRASAFLARADFEFSKDGVEWTGDVPIMPGQYKARAVSKGTFGDFRYSDEMSLTVKKKATEIKLEADKITYGKKPLLTLDLVAGDTLEAYEVILGECLLDAGSGNVSASVDVPADSLKITSKDGLDVTEAYEISIPKLTTGIKPRLLEVTVSDKSAVYNGKPLSYDGYTISENTPLIGDDMLVAVFDASITDVGEIENSPVFTVVNSRGANISYCYEISATVGKLEVEPRPLYVTVDSDEVVYDALPHNAIGYTVSEDTPLAEGQEIIGVNGIDVTDAGEYANLIYFTIFDENGESVIHNYSVFVEAGIITVLPRPVTVTLKSDELTFDGQLHYYGEEQIQAVDGLVDGHSLQSAYEVLYFAGEYTLDMELRILDGSYTPVTSNYAIERVGGKITINKRKITVTPEAMSWVYDGKTHYHNGCTVVGDGSELISSHYAWAVPSVGITDVGEIQNEFARVLIFAEYFAEMDNITQNGILPDDDYNTGTGIIPPIVPETGYWTEEELTEYWTEEEFTEYWTEEEFTEYWTEEELTGYWTQEELTGYWETTLDEQTNDVMIDPSPAPDMPDIDYAEIDVTSCYEITVVDGGMLTVTPCPVTLVPAYYETIYDGTVRTAITAVNKIDGRLVSGHEIHAEGTGVGKIPGYYTSTIDINNVDIVRYFVDRINGKEIITSVSVKHNYEITVVPGTWQILQRPIAITPNDAEKMYDGTPLTASSASIGGNGLVDGHTLYSVEYVGALTNAGKVSSAACNAVIFDSANRNVTEYYNIHYVYGTLTVHQRPIILRPNDDSRPYDGTPLEATSYTVVGGRGFVLDHKISNISYLGSIIDVGEANSTVDVTKIIVTDKDGNDYTRNYTFSTNMGKLTVTKRHVTVTAYSGAKIYDGLTYLDVHADATVNTLADGDLAIVGVTTPLADVGVYTPTLVKESIRIYNRYGENVIDNYGVTVTLDPSATVEIIPREIIVRPASEEKQYDGTPLYPTRIIVAPYSSNSLVSGHTCRTTFLGSQTEVGKSESQIYQPDFIILDENNNPVTHNYNVSFVSGTLTVTEKQSGGGTGSSVGPLDTSGKIGAGEYQEGDGEAVSYLIRSEIDGVIYLKIKSFGAYGGTYWSEAEAYQKLLSGLYGGDYLTGTSLGSSYRIDIQSFTGQYALPYYLMTEADKQFEYDVQKGDVWYTGDASQIYSAYYGVFDWSDIGSSNLTYERTYRSFAYQQYTVIDTESLEYMKKLLVSEGLIGHTDAETVKAIAEYIQNAAKYNLKYNRALDSEDNIAIAFLEKYKEGICQHYATAATLMYRAAGIPARYTIGYVSNTVAGEWVEVSPNVAHAWVEVYIDDLGWVQVEVTGGGFGTGGGGGGTDTEEIIEISPAYQSKTYDGKWLYASAEIEGNAYYHQLISEGYTLTVKVKGQQKDVGIGASTIVSYVLKDPDGNDVTDQFNITCLDGVLEVFDPDIVTIQVQLYELQQYYNGSELNYMVGDYRVLTDLGDAQLYLKLSIGLTDVGKLSFAMLNQNTEKYGSFTVTLNGEDVSHRYRIEFVPLDDCRYPIIVDRRAIEITTASAEKLYDGTALENGGYTITKGSLASGDVIEVTVVGEITEVGEAINTVQSILIKNSNGDDVTQNYEITVVEGLLVVLPDD